MKKAKRVEFYYLPKFYAEGSKDVLAIFRRMVDGKSLTATLETDVDLLMQGGETIVIRPANKKELRKADQELLELLKKGE